MKKRNLKVRTLVNLVIHLFKLGISNAFIGWLSVDEEESVEEEQEQDAGNEQPSLRSF